MTKVVDFSLYGYVHPIGNGDCFLIPIFGDDSNFWVQEINQAGVIPIIFAVSLTLLPQIVGQMLAQTNQAGLVAIGQFFSRTFNPNGFVYNLIYFWLVVGFTYFYTAVTFDPDAISNNLQKSGGVKCYRTA